MASGARSLATPADSKLAISRQQAARPIAAAARPAPRPSLRPAAGPGPAAAARPACAAWRAWPASSERWAKTQRCQHGRLQARRPPATALLAMKPSTTITRRSSAACSTAPAIMAISKPPKAASAAQRRRGTRGAAASTSAQHRPACAPGRRRRGRCRGPRTSSSGRPASRASSKAAAEVLPMPISPSSSTLPGSVVHDRAPASTACSALGRGHRRAGAARRPCPARSCASTRPARGAKSCSHAGVDHGQRQPCWRASTLTRRAAGEEVLDHLPGDVAADRPTRRAPPGRGRRRTPRAGAASQARALGAQDAADLQRQRFQAAERAERLGLAVDALAQRRGQRGIVQVLDVGIMGWCLHR